MSLKVAHMARHAAIFVAILLAPATILCGAATTGADLADILPKILRLGFSNRILSDIDPRDAKAAMELWTKELGRSMGVKAVPQTVIFNSTAELLESVKKGELSFVSLPAIDYLRIRDIVLISPTFIAACHVGKSRELVLITRRDTGFRTINDLRGKRILLPSSTKNEISHIWLDVLLMKEVRQDHSSFFSQSKESTSASQAIMAVFFKQADVAIINRGALETSNMLNPQIGNQLFVIAESKPMVGDITCIPVTVHEQVKQAFVNAALHLHENTVGRQIFTLFQIDRIIPFSPTYLDGTVEVLRERDRLIAKLKKKL